MLDMRVWYQNSQHITASHTQGLTGKAFKVVDPTSKYPRSQYNLASVKQIDQWRHHRETHSTYSTVKDNDNDVPVSDTTTHQQRSFEVMPRRENLLYTILDRIFCVLILKWLIGVYTSA